MNESLFFFKIVPLSFSKLITANLPGVNAKYCRWSYEYTACILCKGVNLLKKRPGYNTELYLAMKCSMECTVFLSPYSQVRSDPGAVIPVSVPSMGQVDQFKNNKY